MTELEYLLLEYISAAFIKLSTSAKGRTGCIVEFDPVTNEEKKIQIIDIDGPVRINITKVANLLRKNITEDRYLEFAVHRGEGGPTIKSRSK